MNHNDRLLEMQARELVQARANGFVTSTGGKDPVFTAFYTWLKFKNLPLVRIRRNRQHDGVYAHVEVNMVTTNQKLNASGIATIDEFLRGQEGVPRLAHDASRTRTAELCCSEWIATDDAENVAAGLFILATDPAYLEPHHATSIPHDLNRS